MDTVVIDMTSFDESLRSLIDCFGIKDKEHLIDEYFLTREKEELSVSDFISYIGILTPPFLESSLILNSIHVTTNDDQCASILKSGLMDLQAAVIRDTPLRNFLKSRNIVIDAFMGEIRANGIVYPLNRNASGSSTVEDDALLEHVSWKLYTDFSVCGFVCTPDALAYGGNVDRRPEFLNNISNLLNRPDLVEEWERETQTHIVKFGLPLSKYIRPIDKEEIGNLLLQTTYDFMNGNGPGRDVYSFLLPHAMVHPNEISSIISAEEYKKLVAG